VVHQATIHEGRLREAEIEAHGYKVLRFPNFQAFEDTSSVLRTIKSTLETDPDIAKTS
jgi:very-short-patch-repair endonuclease